MIETGIIIKALGGFYYVETAEGRLLECRAKGIFRKGTQSPAVGDTATVELDPETGKGMVAALAPRKNFFLRPPLANLDRLFLTVSLDEPPPNLLTLDKLIAIAEHKEIDPTLLVTKTDLGDPAALCAVYRGAGFTVVEVCAPKGEGIEAVRGLIAGRLCAFAGNTGVGKSSLLNAIDPSLGLRTGEISRKLGRGRHTTRHVELYHVAGGLVADTPGFSSVNVVEYEPIFKDQLQFCFREFEPYLLGCRFTGCSHTREQGCAVLQAMEQGAVSRSRHQSYCEMYEESKQLREWELRGST